MTNQYKEELRETFRKYLKEECAEPMNEWNEELSDYQIEKITDFALQKIDEAVKEEREKTVDYLKQQLPEWVPYEEGMGSPIAYATGQENGYHKAIQDIILLLSTPTNKETK